MGKHGDLAAASWELVAISIASWTLRCRASRVRWSTGSTLWMSTLVTTSPLGAKRSCSRKRPLSSKPNTAEQMRRFEFWGHWGHQRHLGMLRLLGQWGHWGTYRASSMLNRAKQNSLFEFLGIGKFLMSPKTLGHIRGSEGQRRPRVIYRSHRVMPSDAEGTHAMLGGGGC